MNRWRRLVVVTAVAALVPAPASAASATVTGQVGVVQGQVHGRAATGSPALDLSTADLTATARALQGRRDFGGLWVSDDNRLVVALTRRPSAAVAATLTPRLPAGSRYELRAVERSWASLLATYRRATVRMERSDDTAVRMQQVGVDVRRNRVEVVVAPSTTVGAERRLAAELGSGVVVVRGGGARAASDRTSPYPHLRAGQRIASGTATCTAGIHFINSLNQYYSLTAGHCGNRSWREGTSSGPSIGSTHANSFHDGTTCDCAAVGPLTAAKATNQVYLSPSTSQPLIQTQYLGVSQTACYSGASTPTNPPKCGKVNRYPVSIRYTNYGNVLVKDLIEVYGNRIQPGDSGSPVYTGYNAVGIGVAYANTGDAWYYHPVQRALQLMSGSLLTYTPGTAP